MKKINFLFGIHCHQPVGNFESVLEQIYKDCYYPFLKVLERHPRIKFTAHYSGILYDWFIDKHPEFIELLSKLNKRHQVELLAGGYYEPILAVIPQEDQKGQIKKHIDFLREKFRVSPRGMWLAERVWEPQLSKLISESAIEYIALDDDHFLLVGKKPSELLGYFITEDEGQALKIFPINRQLRHLVPFYSPEQVIRHLEGMASSDGKNAAILIDDGEKFGARPGSHAWNYKEGYLESFLKTLEDNLEWIRPLTFSDYLEEQMPRGRVYLPSSSYSEMMQWSEGFFRNYFIKYAEANNLHKKMLYVSSKLHALKKTSASGDRKKKVEEALSELYKGQCNCALWHGLFGGLYLPNLRHALYEHLIRSENILTGLQRGVQKFVELVVLDIDKDGYEEVLLNNSYLGLYFSPRMGGSLFELDYKPKAFNLLNVLTRYREPYHKEEAVDDYRRTSFLDHCFPTDATFSDFKSHTHLEVGDFIQGEYEFLPNRKMKEAGLTFSRSGELLFSGKKYPLKISKTFKLMSGQSILIVEYELINLSKETLEFLYGMEFNLNLLACDAADRYFYFKEREHPKEMLDSEGVIDKIEEFKLVDDWTGFSVSFEFSKVAALWRHPLETLSRSESGLERIYQGTVVLPNWRIKLLPQQRWNLNLVLRVES